MDSITDPRHAIGGNNPPAPIEILRAHLTETYSEMMARCAELLALEARLPAEMDDEWEAKISESIKSCTKFIRTSEVTRLEANDPHRALIAATDGFFKKMSERVEALKTKMSTEFLTPYQRDKADREKRRREEEARIAAEEAEEKARLARVEAARVAEAKRKEEEAKAEVERLKRERIEAEEKRRLEKWEAEEKAAADRLKALKREEQLKTEKARAAAAAKREEADRLERERQAAAAAAAREQRGKDRADRDAAAELERKTKAERKEQERAAAEARDRAAVAIQASSKAGRAAGATLAEVSRTRTDLGAVASLHTTWEHEVTDPTLVPRLYLRVSDSAIAAAIKAATHDGRCTLEIEGVRIYPVADSVVR